MTSKKDIEIKSISSSKSDEDFFKIVTSNKEKRLTAYHFVTHFFAFIILLPYLVMIVYQMEIPREYSTIVSVIVGFYFARALFN